METMDWRQIDENDSKISPILHFNVPMSRQFWWKVRAHKCYPLLMENLSLGAIVLVGSSLNGALMMHYFTDHPWTDWLERANQDKVSNPRGQGNELGEILYVQAVLRFMTYLIVHHAVSASVDGWAD